MQWRMVGRRGRAATWTIVGDPAQSSWPVPAESAAARAEALEGKEPTSSTSRPTTATPPRSTTYAAEYAARVGLDADLPDGPFNWEQDDDEEEEEEDHLHRPGPAPPWLVPVARALGGGVIAATVALNFVFG